MAEVTDVLPPACMGMLVPPPPPPSWNCVVAIGAVDGVLSLAGAFVGFETLSLDPSDSSLLLIHPMAGNKCSVYI